MSSSVFSQTDATGYHICSNAVDGESPEVAHGTAHRQLVENHRKLQMELRMGSWWRITGSCRWNCAWAVGGEQTEVAGGTARSAWAVDGEAPEAADETAHGQLVEKHRNLQMELRMGSWWRIDGNCRWNLHVWCLLI